MAKLFGLVSVPELVPRYNVAPSQPVPIVRVAASGEHELVTARWGLIPGWAKDPSIGAKLINARAETVAEKPAFRHAFRHRRCLMPADGFYEWIPMDGRKQPVYVSLRGGEPFAFAALWEVWQPPEHQTHETCALITTEPNEAMASLHNRMPVILRSEEFSRWIDPEAPGDVLREMLCPCPSEVIEIRKVSTFVNNPRNEGPECVRETA